ERGTGPDPPHHQGIAGTGPGLGGGAGRPARRADGHPHQRLSHRPGRSGCGRGQVRHPHLRNLPPLDPAAEPEPLPRHDPSRRSRFRACAAVIRHRRPGRHGGPGQGRLRPAGDHGRDLRLRLAAAPFRHGPRRARPASEGGRGARPRPPRKSGDHRSRGHLAGARRHAGPGQQAARTAGAFGPGHATPANSGRRHGLRQTFCRGPAAEHAAWPVMNRITQRAWHRVRPLVAPPSLPTPARALAWVLAFGLALLLPQLVHATPLPGLTSTPTADGGQQWSIELQTLLLLTSLAFIPALLLMMTSFTRIIIVLSLLRTAMGTQSAPPNQVLLGLTLFLTFFVMAPT